MATAPASAQGSQGVYIPQAEKHRISVASGNRGGPVQAEPERPAAQEHWVRNFAAAASHPNARGVWFSINHIRQKTAEDTVLASCNKEMGGGCQPFGVYSNGWVVIVEDENGGLWDAVATSDPQAENIAVNACRSAGRSFCEAIQGAFADAMQVVHNPALGNQIYDPINKRMPFNRKQFAAAVWTVDSAPAPQRDMMWLQGGFPSRQAAANAVLKICESQSQQKCDVAATAAFGGQIMIASDMKMRTKPMRREGSTLREDAISRMNRDCEASGDSCFLLATYNASDSNLLVINTAEERNKYQPSVSPMR